MLDIELKRKRLFLKSDLVEQVSPPPSERWGSVRYGRGLGLLPVTTNEFLQEEATATTPILGAKRINQEPINGLF
jgi:hypothetical protein